MKISLIVILIILIVMPVSADSLEQAIRDQGLDWVPTEYNKELACGTILTDEPMSPPSLKSFPPSIDWGRPPVRDQRSCGACWAFAAVGCMEYLYGHDDLSEQIVVSCDEWNVGCDGGFMSRVAEFLRTEGTSSESCYPYIARDGNCEAACSDTRLRIYTWNRVGRSVSTLKEALQTAPLPVSLSVMADFRSYRSGIYEMTHYSPVGGHAVLLMGYQDTPDGGYFICKNSWGDDWGEDGYFRIGYSQVSNEVRFGGDAYAYTIRPRHFFPLVMN